MSSAERNLGRPSQLENNTWASSKEAGPEYPALRSWWGLGPASRSCSLPSPGALSFGSSSVSG